MKEEGIFSQLQANDNKLRSSYKALSNQIKRAKNSTSVLPKDYYPTALWIHVGNIVWALISQHGSKKTVMQSKEELIQLLIPWLRLEIMSCATSFDSLKLQTNLKDIWKWLKCVFKIICFVGESFPARVN